ncbi:MAG TPA: PilZ domain-containing protein [Burkholderiaceae bacterium]
MERDKRTHRRKALHTEAAIADVLGNTWNRVELLDISQSGAAFLSAEEYAVGASRMLRFPLPGHEGQLSVLCRIVHCAKHSYLNGFRIGTAFVRIGENEAGAIAAFVA